MNTFDPRSHTYRMDGAIVPSVTQVLKLAGYGYQMFTDVTEHAEFGTLVHKVLENVDNGVEQDIPLEVLPWAERYEIFLKRTKAIMLMAEVQMFSELYQLAGTADNIMLYNGEYGIMDKKSSLNKHPSYRLQCAGYEKLAIATGLDKELGIKLTKRWTLYIGAERYQLVEHKAPVRDMAVFNACLTVAQDKILHKIA